MLWPACHQLIRTGALGHLEDSWDEDMFTSESDLQSHGSRHANPTPPDPEQQQAWWAQGWGVKHVCQ